jgi:hypothetical protein
VPHTKGFLIVILPLFAAKTFGISIVEKVKKAKQENNNPEIKDRTAIFNILADLFICSWFLF